VYVGFGSAGGGTVASPEPQGANCTIVSDTVGMGTARGAHSQFLACDVYSSLLTAEPPDGLFGMPSTPNITVPINPATNFTLKTIFWHLVDSGQLPRPEFSFSLIPDGCRAGVLTLGGTDPSLYVPGTLRKIPLDWPLSESRNWFVIDVRGARVVDGGGRGGPAAGGVAAPPLANTTDGVALVDTGSANMVTPDRDTTRALYGRMSDQIVPIDEMGSWGAPCALLDRVARDVVFTVGTADRHVDVVLRKQYINVGEYPGKPGICQAVFADPPRPAREPLHGRPAWVFGSAWIRSYYTVWNAADRTLGFATPSRGDRD
jgi:hypothetical protein